MLKHFIFVVLMTGLNFQGSHAAKVAAQPVAGRTDPLLVSEDTAVACLRDLLSPFSSVFPDAREERAFLVDNLRSTGLLGAYHKASGKYDLEKIVAAEKKRDYSPRWLTREEARASIEQRFPTSSDKEQADLLSRLPVRDGLYDGLAIKREMLAMRPRAKVSAPAAQVVKPAHPIQPAVPVAKPANNAQSAPTQEDADTAAAIAESLATAQEQKDRGARAEVAGKEDANARRINGVILAIPDGRLINQLDAVTNVFDKYQTAIKEGFPKSRTRLNIDANTQTGKLAGYHLTLVNVDFPLAKLTVSQSRELKRKFNELVAQIQANKNLEFTFERFELLAGEPVAAGERSSSYLVAEFRPNAALQKIMTEFIGGLKNEYTKSDIRIRRDIRYHISLVRMSPLIDVEKMIITIGQLKNYLATGNLAGHSGWVERMSKIDARIREQDLKVLQQPIPPFAINTGTEFTVEVGPREKEPLAREKSQ